jgi:predicted RNA-binding Zn-ribbon protein involved in translation (DUF1610 family)
MVYKKDYKFRCSNCGDMRYETFKTYGDGYMGFFPIEILHVKCHNCGHAAPMGVRRSPKSGNINKTKTLPYEYF